MFAFALFGVSGPDETAEYENVSAVSFRVLSYVDDLSNRLFSYV